MENKKKLVSSWVVATDDVWILTESLSHHLAHNVFGEILIILPFINFMLTKSFFQRNLLIYFFVLYYLLELLELHGSFCVLKRQGAEWIELWVFKVS